MRLLRRSDTSGDFAEVPSGASVDGGGDGDRKCAHAHLVSGELEQAGRSTDAAVQPGKVSAQIVCVLFRLQRDKIAITERPDRLFVMRERFQDVWGRAGNMEEKADGILVASRAQLFGDRKKMIVMNPDHILWGDNVGQAHRQSER